MAVHSSPLSVQPPVEANFQLTLARRRAPGCLGLDEYQDRFRTDAVEFHCFGCRFGLHDSLECFHVGDLDDQAYTLALGRVDERSNGDAQRPEYFFSLW